MTSFIEHLVRAPLASAIGWTIVHSLWEGLVVALALAAILSVVRTSTRRYAAACAAMLILVSAVAVTFIRVTPERTAGPHNAQLFTPRSFTAPNAGGNDRDLGAEFKAVVPWLAPIWIAGVLVFCIRHAACSISAYRLRRRGVCCAPERWQNRIAEFSAQLHVRRPVLLLESCLADVPAVLGYLRPVILMPIGLLAGLPAAQVEAILLHELTHVRRGDYLVNFFQRLIEGALFYHPAVWWISTVMRSERENCCDDAVVAITANPHDYAVALTKLEHSRSAPELAVAAQGGNLVKRVRRLLYPATPQHRRMPVLSAVVLLLTFTTVVLAWQSPGQRTPTPSGDRTVMASPYDRWLNEDVAYIISGRERTAFKALTTDEERLKFVEQFWLRRDPTPGTPENEFKEEHYRRIAFANEHYASHEPGWKTDRGRIYITFGPPDEIESHPSGRPGSPLPSEEWLYHHIDGIGDRIIVEFTDPNHTGEYRMTMDPHTNDARAFVPGGPVQETFQKSGSSESIRVPAQRQEKRLMMRIEPVYPPLALQARVQGVVRLSIVIGKDGRVSSVQFISGHPLLAAAATEAVRQWVYKPTLLDGEPVEVATDVEVNFTLEK